ncbi:MAG: efflux RND transporter periplasmic adaptor subunit [Gemmatimonadales bacterium]|nr:efflux RND transporter periplasmic adaptor subunit [Gemmatimonadales bacterium]
MSRRTLPNRRGWIGTAFLLGAIVTTGAALATWKFLELQKSETAAASQPEPTETITAGLATEREHRPTTTAIGTVLAMRSITLRNEIAGTVRRVALTPGDIVETGALLVALDVSVEAAELEAQAAQAALAGTTLARLESLRRHKAVSQEEVDQARAARDVAQAEMARTRAIIARKTIRAPFRVRVGIADVHPGQYLEEGTELTTLQGIANAAHVDFSVAQRVAAGLREGDRVGVVAGNEAAPIVARILAIDSRVDPTTRNASVRATITGGDVPAPGASVRVLVPVGATGKAVAIPVSALRKGPGGDHVFLIAPDKDDKLRAHLKPVRSGAVVGDEVMILEGLSAGDRVATSGSFKLREAVLVAVADSQATPPAGSK